MEEKPQINQNQNSSCFKTCAFTLLGCFGLVTLFTGLLFLAIYSWYSNPIRIPEPRQFLTSDNLVFVNVNIQPERVGEVAFFSWLKTSFLNFKDPQMQTFIKDLPPWMFSALKFNGTASLYQDGSSSFLATFSNWARLFFWIFGIAAPENGWIETINGRSVGVSKKSSDWKHKTEWYQFIFEGRDTSLKSGEFNTFFTLFEDTQIFASDNKGRVQEFTKPKLGSVPPPLPKFAEGLKIDPDKIFHFILNNQNNFFGGWAGYFTLKKDRGDSTDNPLAWLKGVDWKLISSLAGSLGLVKDSESDWILSGPFEIKFFPETKNEVYQEVMSLLGPLPKKFPITPQIVLKILEVKKGGIFGEAKISFTKQLFKIKAPKKD